MDAHALNSRRTNAIRRALVAILLAVLTASLAILGINTLNERADNMQEAQIALEQVRTAAVAGAAVELFRRQFPAGSALISSETQSSRVRAKDGLTRLKAVGMADVAEDLSDRLNRYDLTLAKSGPDAGDQPLTSSAFLDIMALFRTLDQDGVLFAREAASAARIATVGTAGMLGVTALLVGIFGFFLQTERRRAASLTLFATTDPLTGLPNRRVLDERMVAALALDAPVSVIVFDLDHFKQVNDRFGHAVGDAVLAGAANRLAGLARQNDTVARLGGEEFVWLLPNTDDTKARDAAVRACDAIRATPVAGISITISAGVATRIADEDGADLIRRADSSLYRAKDSGRDRALTDTPRPLNPIP